MKILPLLLLLLGSACAAPDAGEVRQPSSENDYVTGSRIPGKSRASVMSREDVEHLRATSREPIPEKLKD